MDTNELLARFPGDRWIGGGCGGTQMSRHEDRDLWLRRRFEFLAQFTCAPFNGDHIDWPFYHYVKRSYDPLIRPVVRWMNTQPGIQTLYSCQGYPMCSPYVAFAARDFASLDVIYQVVSENQEGWHWDDILISIEGSLGDRVPQHGTFLVQFYDVISLMKFNQRMLGVSLADQFALTESIDHEVFGCGSSVMVPWEQFAAWVGHPYGWPGSKEPDNPRTRQLLDLDNPATRQEMGLPPLPTSV